MMVGMMVFMYLANRQSKLVKSLARACAQNYTISIGIQTVGTTNIIIASLTGVHLPARSKILRPNLQEPSNSN